MEGGQGNGWRLAACCAKGGSPAEPPQRTMAALAAQGRGGRPRGAPTTEAARPPRKWRGASPEPLADHSAKGEGDGPAMTKGSEGEDA